MQHSRFIAIHATSSDLLLLAHEEDTLKANEIIALPTLIAAVILLEASFDTKIYYRVIIIFRNITNSKTKNKTQKH